MRIVLPLILLLSFSFALIPLQTQYSIKPGETVRVCFYSEGNEALFFSCPSLSWEYNAFLAYPGYFCLEREIWIPGTYPCHVNGYTVSISVGGISVRNVLEAVFLVLSVFLLVRFVAKLTLYYLS